MTGPAPLLAAVPYTHDDELLAAVKADGLARARAYRWRGVAVVIGRGNRQRQELNLRHIRSDGVPLLQRPGGGCSVVLDPGNVIVSVALPVPGLGGINRCLADIGELLVDRLAGCGAPGLGIRGVSDLALGDRKVGGSCVYRTRDLLYYSTTLLVDPDPALIERYLLHPPREPDYRAGRSHRDFLGSLAAAGLAQDPEKLARCLNSEFAGGFSFSC